MRRAKWLFALVIILLLFSSGCGQKSADDIVGDLEDTLDSLNSYKAIGTMNIKTGETTQEYSVEVWYKQPNYYRIALSNANSQVTQIVLKNDEGVFVLDPSLNKSFRFKSDWPESNGQVYLFQSLAKSVIEDGERVFSEEEDHYVFQIKGNYQNQTLSQQKVWFDKDLRSIKVEIFDPNQTQLVTMEFTNFEFDVEFEDDAFDMQRNLTGWDLSSMPTLANTDNSKSFGIIEPSYIPSGVTKQAPQVINQGEDRKVVIKYKGEFNYNLTESRPKAISASAPDSAKADIIDLGYGLGILTDMDEIRTLSWTYDGVEFKLTGDLPAEEMVSVAQSVFEQSGK